MSRTVAYFSGCAANYVDPDIGRAVVRVLEKNGILVNYPEQKCCGMPHLGQSRMNAVLDRARFNVNSLTQESGDIVTSCSSCALMIKHYYPRLLNTEEAEAISRRTYDIIEYLVLLHEQGSLDTDFTDTHGNFVYHAPCHLKSLGEQLTERRLKLLSAIPGLSVDQVDRGCCGLAGSFGASKRNRAQSLQIGAGLFEALRGTPDCQVLTECPGCKLQIEQGAGISVIHPIQLFERAYLLE
jgi:glycerol-3-phosphate dehydrogenase subunit C